MTARTFAGLALALSLLAPAFSAPTKFDVGALHVEQVSEKGAPLVLIPGLACPCSSATASAARCRWLLRPCIPN